MNALKSDSLLEMARGAIIERVDHEAMKVYENIKDPNTDPGKTRKITVELKFTADDDRESCGDDVMAAELKRGRSRPEIWTICRPCAESAKDSYELKIQLGKSEKVTCAICGRRRYGNRYEVRRKGGAK